MSVEFLEFNWHIIENIVIYLLFPPLSLFRSVAGHPEDVPARQQRRWTLADSLCDLVHDLRPSLWLFGRSLLEAMDHDPGSGVVERDNASRVVYEQLGLVHDIQGAGGHRRGELQYDRTDNHLRPVYAQYAVQDVGLLLLCHPRGFGIRVSW